MNWTPVPPALRQRAHREAKKIVRDSKSMNPRLGGTLQEHFQGKLAEEIFLTDARTKKLKIKSLGIRSDYSKLTLISADFLIGDKEIELKSRRNSAKLKKFPYLYPISQMLENGITDYVVFIEFNRSLTEYRYGGFIQTYKVMSFEKRMDLPLPAYVVPPEQLTPISQFWKKFEVRERRRKAVARGR